MGRVKERYFIKKGYEDEVLNAGNIGHNNFAEWGEDPTKKTRAELIEEGVRYLNDDDYVETDRYGRPLK